MSVLDYKKIEVSDITFSDPLQEENVYYSIPQYNKEPLLIQTPKMVIRDKLENHNNEIILYTTITNNTFYDFLHEIEDRVITNIASSSISWFGKEINTATLRHNMFRSSILPPVKLEESPLLKTNISCMDDITNCEIYDHKKQILPPMMLSNEKKITSILKCKYIFFTKTQCEICWEIQQILVHKQKKKKISYSIRKHQNEELEIQNDQNKKFF